MQQGTDDEILVQISPLSFSRCSEYIISPQLVPYRRLSLVLPFLLVSDNESETNKPPSHVLKAAAVICEAEPPSLPFTLSLSLYVVGGVLCIVIS